MKGFSYTLFDFRLNSKVKVEIFDTHLTVKNAVKILNNYDVIADCTDNVPTRCHFLEFPIFRFLLYLA